MRDKLLLLMKNEGLTSSRLAELLGIQPSSISHILGGRNKPSFDLVQKILRRFPNINPDWLLIDKGEMYRTDNSATTADDGTALSNDLNSQDEVVMSATPSVSATVPPTMGQTPSIGTMHDNATLPTPSISRGRVKRVIVLYDDHSFESYEISR